MEQTTSTINEWLVMPIIAGQLLQNWPHSAKQVSILVFDSDFQHVRKEKKRGAIRKTGIQNTTQ